jgi:hypothetical protein
MNSVNETSGNATARIGLYIDTVLHISRQAGRRLNKATPEMVACLDVTKVLTNR